MSAREWKPGDVALVEAGCWANRKVALRLAEGWAHTNGVNVDGDGVVTAVRPLVVIDPEDREQVERLDGIYQAALDSAPKFHSLADVMQAALREFANPTPPKPDEPTGLGAVVEDAEGHKWTRANSAGEWYCECGDDIYETWAKFPDPVRVLSEGVSP